MKFSITDDKKTLIAERTFSASVEKVWEAFSDSECFAKWMHPNGWETEVRHMEFHEGGYLHYGMKCVDPKQTEWFGKYSWGKSTYTKIVEHTLIEYTDAFCNDKGEVASDMPSMHITLEFFSEDEKTRLVSTTLFASEAALTQVIDMGMKEGFTQTWDNLESFLAS